MEIISASLKAFRNIAHVNAELSPGINIFYGDNGQGKTNFLESLYFCATGRSHRTHNDKELINFDENEAFVQIYFDNNGIKDKINVHLKKEGKKGVAINNIPIRKMGDLLGKLIVVMFSPEDLNLVKQGPSERRKFMDMEICQISNIYYYELTSYHRVLKQRNNLLKSCEKNKELLSTISVWDEQLVSHGTKIYEIRRNFVENISEISAKIYGNISDNKEALKLFYKPNITPEGFESKLKKNIERDIFMGSTSSGIHKDDISILINDYDIRLYGSQGQQRTASLSMKLAEIEIINLTKSRKPVLLLDDVLSELDEKRQEFLLHSINDIQTVITCTGVEDIIHKLKCKNNINLYKVDSGNITKG